MSPSSQASALLYATILLKSNNQSSIALIYNLVFYIQTKRFNIQYYYIKDKVVTKKIKLIYIPINKIIAISLTKALSYIKFYRFIN